MVAVRRFLSNLLRLQDCEHTRVGLQNVYANMEGNVLVHVSAPALGLSSAHWAVVSWGQSQLTRESVYDAKYIYRCAACSTSMQ